MRLPKRQSQLLRQQLQNDDAVAYLTAAHIEGLKKTLDELQRIERPRAVEDVSRSVALGDLSENAEYQEAKARMARIDGRIFSIQQRLKRAIPLPEPSAGDTSVQLGSKVTILHDEKEKTYHIVGPLDANPSALRISYLSPLGSALMHHFVGDSITIQTPAGEAMYQIMAIN